MAVLPIITLHEHLLKISASALRQKSSVIDLNNSNMMGQVLSLVEDMFETMYSSPWAGVGLAAPQVGVLWRLIVIDFQNEPYVVINPRITSRSEENEVGSEVCLSLPFMTGDVQRNKSIKLEFFDLNGELHTREEEGFRAVVFQHEIDHLDGVLYVDRLVSAKKIRSIDLPSVRATRKAMKTVTPQRNQTV